MADTFDFMKITDVNNNTYIINIGQISSVGLSAGENAIIRMANDTRYVLNDESTNRLLNKIGFVLT